MSEFEIPRWPKRSLLWDPDEEERARRQLNDSRARRGLPPIEAEPKEPEAFDGLRQLAATDQAAEANGRSEGASVAQAAPENAAKPKQGASEADVTLLGRLIFAEGANHHDTEEAMEGIGWAVANRVGAPGFPKTLEGVIHQPGQFDATHGKLWADAANPASLTGANAMAYARALETAQGVLDKRIADPIEGAQFFYSGKPGADAPKSFFRDGLINQRLEKVKERVGDFTFVRDRRR